QRLLGDRTHSVRLSPGDQLGLGPRGCTEALSPLPGRHAVKLFRLLSRIALLSMVGAALAGLTGIFGDSVRTALPNPGWQAERRPRPSAPRVYKFTEFAGAIGELALFAVGGRIVLRLRLSAVPRSEGQPILLNLHRGRRTAEA